MSKKLMLIALLVGIFAVVTIVTAFFGKQIALTMGATSEDAKLFHAVAIGILFLANCFLYGFLKRIYQRAMQEESRRRKEKSVKMIFRFPDEKEG